ncbi:hypothetical protein MAR_024207 [Mya arenaria]|uniref:Uncharacterized protein n=1 Tax=Mya arenaria TaxID=6604 RepID=A0ABY7DQZ2_MYAAR|nr:uncharacterized protein LOC128228831 [Mya arenaria]XP_052796301.1 uncharacterized protein LOC128228831 [Mya arenaria]WAQ99834.1 hypothetical protein MAR_024207 [Mya arenaria]
MELHVWARFDTSGKIESVQSSFSQTPETQNPPGWVGSVAPEGGERFVPYEEKKDLDTKLTRKVDEMGLIVMQMAELSKRNKIQEKLIRQYEERIKTLENELHVNNHKTSDNPAAGERTCGCRRQSQTEQKTVSMTTSVTIQCSCASQSLCPKDNDNEGIAITEENDLSKEENRSGKSQHSRPSTLNIDVGSSSSNGSVSFSGNMPPTSVTKGYVPNEKGYCYARSIPKRVDSDMKCVEDESHTADAETYTPSICDNLSPSKDALTDVDGDIFGHLDCQGYLQLDTSKQPENRDSPLGCVDSKGYLILTGRSLSAQSEQMHGPHVPDMEDGAPNHHMDRCSPVHHVNEQIHVSFKEFRSNSQEKDTIEQVPVSCSPTQRQSVTFDPAHEVHTGYIEIPETSTSERNPMPVPRRPKYRTSSGGEADLVKPKRHGARSETVPGSSSRQLGRDSPPTPLVDTHKGHEHPLSPALLNGFHRNSCPDIRKDDNLNTVLKDMRTTAEWNQEKQRLIFRSSDCTASVVEHELGATVQVIYQSFKSVAAKKGHHKVMVYPTADLFKRVRREIYRQSSRDVSEDFCCKCLDIIKAKVKAKSP